MTYDSEDREMHGTHDELDSTTAPGHAHRPTKFKLTSLRYTYCVDGRIAVANNMKVIGHVEHNGEPDVQLSAWLNVTTADARDVRQSVLMSIVDNANLVRCILEPGQSVQVDDTSAVLDPRTLVERRVYEQLMHRLLSWLERQKHRL
jgi:hypothetical protein